MDPYDDHEQFVPCAQGHMHWGKYGAAGAFLRHVDDQGRERYFLQQRSPEVQLGGTWSTPGGAMMQHESPQEAALREAQEELGHFPVGNLEHFHTQDHGGWAYHTVRADVPQPFYPTEHNFESTDSGWFTPHEIDELPLHPGFRQTWDEVKPNQPSNPKEVWSFRTAMEDPRGLTDGLYYHVAPTTERARIQQHGLFPSDPANSGMWTTFGDGKYEPPRGVYLSPDRKWIDGYRERLEFRRGVPHDLWEVKDPGEYTYNDPDLGLSSKYVTDPIPAPRLVEGPEHREYMPEYMMQGYVRPTDPWQRPQLPMGKGEGRGQPYPVNDPQAFSDRVGSHKHAQDMGWREDLWGERPPYFYHFAPTEDRARIQAHDLHPSYPGVSERWGDEGYNEAEDQHPGVYVFDQSHPPHEYTGEAMDRWRIPSEQVHSLHEDQWSRPDNRSFCIHHSVTPELDLPWEHSQDPEGTKNWRLEGNPVHPEWGIGTVTNLKHAFGHAQKFTSWYVPVEEMEEEGSTVPTEVMNPEDHWPEWGQRPRDNPNGTVTDYGWAYKRT